MATTAGRDGVRLERENSLVTAVHVDSGVAASGHSEAEALSELADALELHEGGGEPITDEDGFFEEIGLDADDIHAARERAREEPLPAWME